MHSHKAAVIVTCITLVLFASSCRRHTKPQLAFYHWSVNTSYGGGQRIDSVLHHFNNKTLYTKIMDIDWDEAYGVYPSTTVSMEQLRDRIGAFNSDTFHITPVIFITVKALQKTDDTAIARLAQKIVLKTTRLVQDRNVYDNGVFKDIIDTMVHYDELQLDCDWTASTQKKYFALLTEIKKLLPQKSISSTLRLHQFAYPQKTGVPPADELYLMCYNTGELKKLNEANSIFNYAAAKQYFDRAGTYPKKLNFALPAFDWVIIFKNEKFYKIDNALDDDFFGDTTIVRPRINNTWYMLVDTVVHNIFLRKGDVLKWEKITPGALQQAAQLCRGAVNSSDFKVVLYDIDHIKPDQYEAVEKAFNSFVF